MDEVTVPYAIAFHPQTHYYYTIDIDKTVQDMNTQDWIDFLTSIVTGKREVCSLLVRYAVDMWWGSHSTGSCLVCENTTPAS